MSTTEIKLPRKFGNLIISSLSPLEFKKLLLEANKYFLDAALKDPSIQNAYVYVKNNPINWIDSSGELIDPVIAGLVLLIAMEISLFVWMMWHLHDKCDFNEEAPEIPGTESPLPYDFGIPPR